MRWSCFSMRSICRRASSHCRASSSAARAPASCRWARFTIAATISRSRSNSAVKGFLSCRCVLKSSSGSSRMRLRTACEPLRQAAYSWPASPTSEWRCAKIAAIRWQSAKLWRATGARNSIATCAGIWPSRTCCWIASGRTSTSASRRDTQLTLRSKRRANSSSPLPKRCSNSANSQPTSSAVSCSAKRSERSSSTAAASPMGHTTAATVSRPSCSSAAIRL